MRVLWRISRGSVEDVREGLPGKVRSAHNTVQTVLNRLAERRLVSREKVGNRIFYEPRVTEGEYLARSVDGVLASASDDARRVALANLVGDLEPEELAEVQRMAREIALRREG